jgi:uncharacterized membrane protein
VGSDIVQDRWIHRLFRAGLALKGINAMIESLAGLSMVALNSDRVRDVLESVAQGEVLDDPNDIVATDFARITHFLDGHHHHFLAYYLLAHGAVKVVMVLGLMRRTAWSYPFALVALTGFIIYQSYRVVMTHSILLTFLTLFDCAFLYLVWKELQIQRRNVQP